MHTFELQRRIKSFFISVESVHPFIEALKALSLSADIMEKNLPGIAVGGAQLNQWAHQIHNHLANVRTTTSTINQRQFFKALEHFNGAVSQLDPTNIPSSNLISGLSAKVEEFASLYDAFLSIQSGENAVPLLLAAKSLCTEIETLFGMLQLVEGFIGTYDLPANSEAPLTLLLPAHLDLTDFARKLIAIQELYTEMCMLFSLSESSNPLRISKIESGSLWIKFFGESRVVEMMSSFLENTASWIFRTYTNEGKIASVPRKVEAIESLLQLSERLADAGVNTSEMKGHIEKSAVAISKNLNQILDGQSSIVVNNRAISVGSEVTRNLIEQTSPLQLQNASSITDDEPPDTPLLR